MGAKSTSLSSTWQPAGREAEVTAGSSPTRRSAACAEVQLAVSSPLPSPQPLQPPAKPSSDPRSDRSGVPPIRQDQAWQEGQTLAPALPTGAIGTCAAELPGFGSVLR